MGEWLPVVIASILSGGFVAGIVSFIKVGREKDRISVAAAEGALVVQGGVLKSLESENSYLKTALKEAREWKDDCRRRNILLVNRIRELQEIKGIEPEIID